LVARGEIKQVCQIMQYNCTTLEIFSFSVSPFDLSIVTSDRYNSVPTTPAILPLTRNQRPRMASLNVHYFCSLLVVSVLYELHMAYNSARNARILRTNWKQNKRGINCDMFFFFFLWHCGPTRAMASSFWRFLDHTQRRITVGRTPLDE